MVAAAAAAAAAAAERGGAHEHGQPGRAGGLPQGAAGRGQGARPARAARVPAPRHRREAAGECAGRAAGPPGAARAHGGRARVCRPGRGAHAPRRGRGRGVGQGPPRPPHPRRPQARPGLADPARHGARPAQLWQLRLPAALRGLQERGPRPPGLVLGGGRLRRADGRRVLRRRQAHQARPPPALERRRGARVGGEPGEAAREDAAGRGRARRGGARELHARGLCGAGDVQQRPLPGGGGRHVGRGPQGVARVGAGLQPAEWQQALRLEHAAARQLHPAARALGGGEAQPGGGGRAGHGHVHVDLLDRVPPARVHRHGGDDRAALRGHPVPHAGGQAAGVPDAHGRGARELHQRRRPRAHPLGQVPRRPQRRAAQRAARGGHALVDGRPRRAVQAALPRRQHGGPVLPLLRELGVARPARGPRDGQPAARDLGARGQPRHLRRPARAGRGARAVPRRRARPQDQAGLRGGARGGRQRRAERARLRAQERHRRHLQGVRAQHGEHARRV